MSVIACRYFLCEDSAMADSDITDIWDECDREIESLRKVAANNQLGFEETIGNLAALKMLSDSTVEEAVKN